MALKVYNTLSHKVEEFIPIDKNNVGLYTCGPTVYNFVHIGNLRTYIFEDILHRTLLYLGYIPKHVMNITDVGHLVSDQDTGEDKMEKGSKREGKTAWEIAEFYTKAFNEDARNLNILEPDILCRATDHINEQVNLIQILIDKNFTYKTSDGIYFDTTKIDDYGKLVNLKNQSLEAGARIDMGEKKNIHDFALWKFTVEGEQRQMEWDAFGRKGFPGWHIECSAMALEYLGEHFDIHCGGIDHPPIHHTNEIAQTESATGIKPWVNYWMHGEFMNIKNSNNVEKMAKSGDNFITLNTLIEKGYSPLEFRFYLLGSQYRTPINFSYEILDSSKIAFKKLTEYVRDFCEHEGIVDVKYKARFTNDIEDDLNMPRALATMWELIKDANISKGEKYETLLDFDRVLGLKLSEIKQTETPIEIEELLLARAQAKDIKDFQRADEIRKQIEDMGYEILDTKDGIKVKKL